MPDGGGGGLDPAFGSALVDSLVDMVFVVDGAGRLSFGNQRCRDLLGWADEQLGVAAVELVHPDDVAVVVSSMATIRGKHVGSPIEIRIRDRNGHWHWVELVGSDRTSDPMIGGVVCVARDITERRRWEIAGGDGERLGRVVQHGSSIVMVVDAAGVVVSANNALNRILGHDKSVVIGAPLAELAVGDDRERLEHALGRCVADGRPVTVEVHMRHADADQPPCPVRFELRNLLGDPSMGAIVVNGYDITELFAVRQRLERLVLYDELTGIANRSLLLSTVERWLRDEVPVAALFIDLDRFKPVNDRLGHRAGDELLSMVADRLRQATRPVDLVARFGGDEFVVAAPGVTTEEHAMTIAQRLAAVFDEPFGVGGEQLMVRGSVGIALSSPASSVAELIDEADRSMYRTKRRR